MIAKTYIKVYYKEDVYTETGTDSTWVYWGRVFGNWRGTYGKRVLEAKALGSSDTATIHTFYNPDLYEKLQTQECILIKNGTVDEFVQEEVEEPFLNAYELFSSVENIKEANQEIEFMVKRYVQK